MIFVRLNTNCLQLDTLTETIVPLVITFHLRLKDLNSLIKKDLQYLNAD